MHLPSGPSGAPSVPNMDGDPVFARAAKGREWPRALAILLALLLIGVPLATFLERPATPDGGPPPGVSGANLTVTVVAAPSAGTHPLFVSFDSQVSGNYPPFTYSWQFGDVNGCCPSADPDPSHVYNSSGTFQAVLSVTDARGDTGQGSLQVVVDPTVFSSVVVSSENLTLMSGSENFTALPFEVPSTSPGGGAPVTNASLSGDLAASGCSGPHPCDAFFVAVMTSDQLASFQSTGNPSAVWCEEGGAGSGCLATSGASLELDLSTYEGGSLYLVLWDHNPPSSPLYLAAEVRVFGAW